MNKRTFLKISSAMITGGILSPLVSCKQGEKQHNWAGNLEYGTDNLHEPKTLEEVQEIVKKCNKLRALGTRHSFNGIADSTENLVSVKHLNQVISLDETSHTVTVGAGMRYGELSQYLHSRGFALHNLASLPHISVAGACSTATHGSGVKNSNLATAVSALDFVSANGEVHGLTREKDSEQFAGAVIGLGGIGVITKLTLNIQPTFNVRQDVYQNLPLRQLADHFDEIMSSGYSVSLFTDWQDQNVSQIWIKRRIVDGGTFTPPPEFFGATLAAHNLHPIVALSAENCTEQMGIPGPWHERLPHFKLNFTPSSGAELQAEYFVAHEHAIKAILALEELRADIKPNLLITEIRTIDGDDFWMSPCYQQQSVAIHFTLKPDWPGVSKLLPRIEEKLAAFNARPHWAKMFTMSPSRLQALYTKLPDFKKLLAEYDPLGKFRNEFINNNLFGASA